MGLHTFFSLFKRPTSKRSGYELITGESSSTQNIIFEDETLEVFAYKQNKRKQIMFHVVAILLLGLPYLLLHWFTLLVAKLKFSRCSLSEADMLLLKDTHNKCYLVYIHVADCTFDLGEEFFTSQRYFDFRFLRYVWDGQLKEFKLLKGLSNGQNSFANLLCKATGLTQEEQAEIIKLYGPNKICVGEKSYWRLFVEEVFNPFYVFQIGSIILWCFDEYYVYAICILFLSGLSIFSSLFQTKKQQKALQAMVEASEPTTIDIIRSDGNIVVIPEHGCVVPCDVLLLTGACIVNESMLTGECVPVTKSPPQLCGVTIYDPVVHKRHTLYSGTTVIQTRFYGCEKVSALVVRTGFSTMKGALIRSILYPRHVGFKFYADSVKFLTALCLLAAMGMAYSVYLYVRRGDIIIRTLDVITIAVPPALPAAMTAGTVFSQNRLKKLGIFCISPPRINICGKIKLACFDKTGTLTEDGLVFCCVVPCSPINFLDEIRDPSIIPIGHPVLSCMATCHCISRVNGELIGDPLDMEMFTSTKWILDEPVKGTAHFDLLAPIVVRPPSPKAGRVYTQTELASMHELADVDVNTDAFSSFVPALKEFHEGEMPHPSEIGIVRQFPFSSNEQCMSVITRSVYQPMVVFAKGAPERIHSMCDLTTVPTNYHGKVRLYTALGYRVIALAYKRLDPKLTWLETQKLKRTDVECNLTFLGLMIFQNNLKPESLPVIRELQNSEIRCVMITGDNLLTAVSVARSCEMIPYYCRVIQVAVGENRHTRKFQVEMQYVEVHENLGHGAVIGKKGCATHFMNLDHIQFAVEGSSWTLLVAHFPELLPYICTRGTVFARMTPEDKTQVIEQLQKLDYIVSMCGDGANDCGALKAADIGISLSEAEASVAAPFTSHDANISCVPKLVQEGRCALVTSFGLFKYMAMYSLIQFTSVLILYTKFALIGAFQFLFIDLVITTSLAMVMGRARPTNELSAKRPTGSLVSFNNLFPLAIQVLIMVIVQIVAMYYLTKQSWYVPIKPSPNSDMIVCWENTTLFLVSCFQYLILAAVYSKGKPYRQPQYKNVLLVITLAMLSMFCTLILIYPPKPLAYILEIEPLGSTSDEVFFRLSLLLLPVIHLIIALLIEVFVADTKWLKGFAHWLTGKKMPKNRYKHIDNELITRVHWVQPRHFRSM